MTETGPCSGISVLDLSAVLAAPVAATLLAEFGADVIKIEQPGVGDFLRQRAHVPGGRTPQWAQEGRNKHSVTLDLRHPQGQELARRLAETVDVVVTNYRPTTASRWGLTPDDLLAVAPDLVVLSVTGYGLSGPYADRGAFDRVISAFAGHTEMSGYPDRPPVRGGYAVIDFLTAYLGAFAVLAALRARDRGAGGQVIDAALYEVAFRASEASLSEYVFSGRRRTRVGNRNPGIVPATEAPAADGRRVSYHAGTEPLFCRLVEVMHRPDLLEDVRFSSMAARVAHQDELYQIIEDWLARHPGHEVVDRLSEAGIPASLVNDLDDLLADEHFRARSTFSYVDDDELGRLPYAAPVPRLSVTPARVRHLGLSLGACTEEVLGGRLGLSSGEIGELRAEGVV